MKSQAVRWAVVLGIVASVVHGTSGRSAAQNPTLDVGSGYDIVDSIGTGAPVQVSGYTSIYDTEVAFKTLWNTADSPLSVPFHAWTDDLWIDYYGSVPGGQQGTSYEFAPIGLLSAVTLNVEAYHPLYGFVVASDSHSEGVSEASTAFSDWLDGCDISASVVSNWAQQDGDAAVESTFGAVFTLQAMADYALQHNLTEAQVQQMVSDLRESVKQQLRPIWIGWVDTAYGVQAQYVIRIGSNNPFLGPVQAALDSIPDAINGGIADLQQPGETLDDIKPQVLDFFPDPGAISEMTLDELDAYRVTGVLPSLSTKYTNKLWFQGNKAGFHYPARILGQPGYVSGSIKVDVEDVTFFKIGGASVEGHLEIEQLPHPGYYFTVGGTAQETIRSQSQQNFSIGGVVVFP